MDDIAFFESSQYHHRGGIWADASRPSTPGPTPASTSASMADEVPDAGNGDQRRIDSRTHVTRPSYAEVRAAVEERRERERPPLGEASSRSNQQASEPIVVPLDGKGKDTAVLGAFPRQAMASSPPARVDEVPAARSVSPAALPVERSDSHVSTSSRESAAQVLAAPEEPERPPSPIHTQPPPPKTMTIPGIHASHLGEVMSMGFVALQPAPQESKKAPPLQSVYHLWKNPGAASSTVSEPVPVSQTEFSGRDQDSGAAHEGEPSPTPPRPVPLLPNCSLHSASSASSLAPACHRASFKDVTPAPNAPITFRYVIFIPFPANSRKS